jgi:hypothetical protein
MVWRRESATLKPPGDVPRGRDIPQILRPGRPRIGPLSLAGAERERWTCSAKTPVNRPPSTQTRLPDRQSSVFMCHGETISDGQTPPSTSTQVRACAKPWSTRITTSNTTRNTSPIPAQYTIPTPINTELVHPI